MAESIKFELQGLQQLLARLDSDALLRKPVRKLMSSIGRRGKEEGRSSAPRRTGTLAGSFAYRVSPKSVPTFVAIHVKAKRGSVSYPRVLEYSPKHGHKGWLLRAVQAARPTFSAILAKAGKEIEAAWRR